MSRLYQCKKCGGQILPQADGKHGVCESCGETATLPKSDTILWNRANEFRRRLDFDQAQMIYRNLCKLYPEDSENWWGSFLCEYGVEYVETNGERKPTVNRMKYDSVFDNEDYKKAVANADPETKWLYEADARELQNIQEKMLELAAKQEPYEVFICHKASDEVGERTLDSVIGQDIYDALTKEGYRVFFSRQTLREWGGYDYEPLIFSALKSASVMVVIGTKKEYLDAPWVKNEWSRFLKMMRTDADKHLLPIFADMDPKDFPREFGKQQGLNARDLGFIPDLLENIGELTGRRKEKRLQEEASAREEAIFRARAVYLAEQADQAEDRERAEKLYRDALEMDEMCAPAWWGLFRLEGGLDEDDKSQEPWEKEKKREEYQEKAFLYANAKQEREYQRLIEQKETNIRRKRFQKGYDAYRRISENSTRLSEEEAYWKDIRFREKSLLADADQEQWEALEASVAAYHQLQCQAIMGKVLKKTENWTKYLGKEELEDLRRLEKVFDMAADGKVKEAGGLQFRNYQERAAAYWKEVEETQARADEEYQEQQKKNKEFLETIKINAIMYGGHRASASDPPHFKWWRNIVGLIFTAPLMVGDAWILGIAALIWNGLSVRRKINQKRYWENLGAEMDQRKKEWNTQVADQEKKLRDWHMQWKARYERPDVRLTPEQQCVQEWRELVKAVWMKYAA